MSHNSTTCYLLRNLKWGELFDNKGFQALEARQHISMPFSPVFLAKSCFFCPFLFCPLTPLTTQSRSTLMKSCETDLYPITIFPISNPCSFSRLCHIITHSNVFYIFSPVISLQDKLQSQKDLPFIGGVIQGKLHLLSKPQCSLLLIGDKIFV